MTHTFVGGPYKGFFHVPRGLFFSALLLDDIIRKEQDANNTATIAASQPKAMEP